MILMQSSRLFFICTNVFRKCFYSIILTKFSSLFPWTGYTYSKCFHSSFFWFSVSLWIWLKRTNNTHDEAQTFCWSEISSTQCARALLYSAFHKALWHGNNIEKFSTIA
jgi:hypothetical protein